MNKSKIVLTMKDEVTSGTGKWINRGVREKGIEEVNAAGKGGVLTM